MTLSLTSTDFDDGDYLALTHLLSEPFGFGCDLQVALLGCHGAARQHVHAKSHHGCPGLE